ncbi:MAG TPA: BatA and WFA domain-containing protein [Gemmata sp.]|jgi:hypothetical protein|nr:BatA and WFA domain-containing protein [Gemmata sp.]
MLPLFTTPLALFGLASLPALVAIYYFRSRPRKQVVSSLLLWIDPQITQTGGARFERLRTPLLFWLEILALLLLTLAATGPLFSAGNSSRPLVVVLDDSYSMLAGGPDSPRKRAVDALLEELKRTNRRSVRLVLAGQRPQILGEGTHERAEVERLLAGWTCHSSAAALDTAVGFALDLGSDLTTVLVLTDHPPDSPPGVGRVRWWSFGTARPNWAFVNASRVPGSSGDRLLLEIANLSNEPGSTTLRIETGEPARELKRSELRLNAFETQRVIMEVPGGDSAPSIRAVLDSDDLPIDNSLTLLSTPRRTVRYDLRLTDAKIRSSVERALKASGAAKPADERPHLIFHNSDVDTGRTDQDDAWGVRILAEQEAEAYTGPFVLDRSHPLVQGLSLTGVVWGGGNSRLPGAPVVMAGNVQLLTDSESQTGKHDLQLRLRHDLSTLLESPAWPALIWNMVQWRASYLPGLDQTNVRLGQEVSWSLGRHVESIEMIKPGGATSSVPVHGRRVTVRAEHPGVYRLRNGTESVEFATNPLSRDESDLTTCATGQWGEEQDSKVPGIEYRNITWILVLLAFGVLTLHLYVRARMRTS